MSRAIVVSLFIFSIILATPVRVRAQAACTRADLQSAVDSYLAAQRTGKADALPLAAAAKYIENTETSSFDKGILKNALKIDFSRSLLDTTICETFTEVIVTDKSHPYVLGVRTKVTNRKIAELETLVTDADDWLFNEPWWTTRGPSDGPPSEADGGRRFEDLGSGRFLCSGVAAAGEAGSIESDHAGHGTGRVGVFRQ